MKYKDGFYLTGRRGNNAFAYDDRGKDPSLYVPAVLDGGFSDLALGDEIAFEDFDENGVLLHCRGLRNFVRMDWGGVPCVVVDNHNHALYFWYEALEKGILERGACLIHIDQHKDMREPESWLGGADLDEVFKYTNEVVNVGNYILPAMKEGLVREMQMVQSEAAVVDLSYVDRGNKILNIDLDFFADEMDYIDFGKVKKFIDLHLATASLVTVATSPFFIEQEKAIGVLGRLLTGEE